MWRLVRRSWAVGDGVAYEADEDPGAGPRDTKSQSTRRPRRAERRGGEGEATESCLSSKILDLVPKSAPLGGRELLRSQLGTRRGILQLALEGSTLPLSDAGWSQPEHAESFSSPENRSGLAHSSEKSPLVRGVRYGALEESASEDRHQSQEEAGDGAKLDVGRLESRDGHVKLDEFAIFFMQCDDVGVGRVTQERRVEAGMWTLEKSPGSPEVAMARRMRWS